MVKYHTEHQAQNKNDVNKRGEVLGRHDHLLNIPGENIHQFTQLFLSLAALRSVDAVVKMAIDELLRERLDRFTRRHQLSQDLRAIAVFVQHALDRVQLTDDLADSHLESLLFALRVMV